MIRTFSLAWLGLIVSFLVAAEALAGRPEIGVPPLVAADMVRGYFDALRRQDRGALSAVTVGQASERTDEVLDRIRVEAQKRKVGVELKLRQLAVSPLGKDVVEAKFDIAVIAHKWVFSMVAHQLKGRATFYVGGNLAKGDSSAPKIVGIKLFLD